MALKLNVNIDVETYLQNVEHFVCCHDLTKTYCGISIPASDDGWSDTVECPVCMAVDALDALQHGDTGKTFCPVDGVCSHAEGNCHCPPDDLEED